MRSVRRLPWLPSAVLLALSAACSSSSSPATSADAGGHDAQSRDAALGKDAKAADGAKGGDAGNFASIPVTQTFTAKVLSAPVDVVRDEFGIPHIYGATFPDVAYAEGYVMAADRLVEMDLGRREGEGTLAELVGGIASSYVANDIAMRMNHLTATAQQTWQELQASTDPKDKALALAITNFAAGVNAYVADVNAGKAALPAAVSPPYTVTNFAPWSEIDSFVMGYVLAFELAYDVDTEITFTQIQAAGAALFDNATSPDLQARKGIAKDLERLSPQDPTFILPSGWTGFGGDTTEAKAGPARHKPAARVKGAPGKLALSGAGRAAPRKGGGAAKDLLALFTETAKTMHGIGVDRLVYTDRGSNNFVLGPSLTADKNVIVGNDTHLSLSNPPVFYLAQVVATGGDLPVNAIGASLAGVPGIVLGNNEHIAWAATDNYIDVTDVYQETVVNCADSTPFAGTGSPCVVFNGKNVALTPRTESFKVGFFGNVTSTVTETLYDVPQHGPIIPRLDANHHVLPLGSSELSVRYTGYQPSQIIRALFGVSTAKTMQEAVAALDKDFGVGGENWVIGDDQGNFGWTEVCTVPLRAAGHAPWLVLPGDGSAEWGANMDRHYIPHAYNPSAGFIVTANNDPVGVTKNNDPFFTQPVVGGSPLYLGFNYNPGTRAGRMTQRIQSMASAGHKFTQADVAAIQGDIVTEWGQAMAPTFIAAASDLAAEIASPGSHPGLTQIAAGADATAKGLVQTAHDIMAAWTSFETPSGLGDESSPQQFADSQAALLNAVFYANFAHLTFDDELAVLGVSPGDVYLRKLLVTMCTSPTSLATQVSSTTGDNILFDNLTTPGVVESKEQVAAQAILNTLDFVVKTLGADPTKWAWGSLHTLTLDSLLPLGPLNLPPQGDSTYPNGYPRHGDDGTVDVGTHGLSLTTYSYVEGPAIRFGADLNPAGITAQNALPGGEVFDPTSPHFKDQMAFWLKGEPFALAQTVAAVTASAATEYAAHKDGRIRFTP